MKKITFLIMLGALALSASSQSADDVLNVLVQKNVIAQKDADSLRAEAAIASQANLAKVKAFPLNAGKKLQLAGYTQLRYQVLEEAGKIDGFDVRRARLDVRGNVSAFWGYRVQFDLAGTPKLIDAYAELKLNDQFNFTIGQAKIPFSLENLASSNKLELIDRSQVVEALVARNKDVVGNQNGRDIGIQAGGTILKQKDRALVDYRLGIYNGSGTNVADKNENKDWAARLILHPLAGLDISGAYYDGSVYKSETEKSVNRDRYGFDLSYDRKDLSIRGEFIHGKDGPVDREGYYAQAGYYFFQKKLQLLAKYDFYDADQSKANDASTWVILGANYNFNTNTRLQCNYSIKQEEGPDIANNLTSFQFQIGF